MALAVASTLEYITRSTSRLKPPRHPGIDPRARQPENPALAGIDPRARTRR